MGCNQLCGHSIVQQCAGPVKFRSTNCFPIPIFYPYFTINCDVRNIIWHSTYSKNKQPQRMCSACERCRFLFWRANFQAIDRSWCVTLYAVSNSAMIIAFFTNNHMACDSLFNCDIFIIRCTCSSLLYQFRPRSLIAVHT